MANIKESAAKAIVELNLKELQEKKLWLEGTHMMAEAQIESLLQYSRHDKMDAVAVFTSTRSEGKQTESDKEVGWKLADTGL